MTDKPRYEDSNDWYEAHDKDGEPISDSLIDALYALKKISESEYDSLEGLLERLIARTKE